VEVVWEKPEMRSPSVPGDVWDEQNRQPHVFYATENPVTLFWYVVPKDWILQVYWWRPLLMRDVAYDNTPRGPCRILLTPYNEDKYTIHCYPWEVFG